MGMIRIRNTGSKLAENSLQNALHRLGVQPVDERLDKGHLLPRVLHDDGRVAGGTAQEVGRKHHGQVGGVHLGHARHVRPECAQRMKEQSWNYLVWQVISIW